MAEADIKCDQKPVEPKPEPEFPVERDWLVSLIGEKCGVKAALNSYKCSIIGEGKGFLSVCTRVTFDWNANVPGSERLPKGVIIKKPTLDKIASLGIEELTDIMDVDTLSNLHNREVRAYTFFNKHQPSPIPMAKLFCAEPMTDLGTGMLIMDDLTDSAVSLGFGDSCTKEKLLSLAEHTATLQAYGFNHPDFVDYITRLDLDKMNDGYSDKQKIVQKVVDTFPEMPYTADQLTDMLEKTTSDFELHADPTSNGYSPVIVLGDCQPNNILWTLDKDGGPSDQVEAFLDFQVAGIGYCIADLSSSIVLGTPANLRRECEDEVFARYLKVLEKKSDRPVEISIKEIKKLYRKFLCFLALMAFPTMVKLYTSLGMESKISETYDRFIGAVEDSQIEDY